MLRGFSLGWVASMMVVSGLLGASLPAFADSNQLITYQGRILRPDGTPLEGTIDFSIKIYSPGPAKCLLWAETQTIPMSGSMGAFSLEIGKDINRVTGANGGGATSFGQVFVNHPSLVINSAQCNTGYTSYTANYADDRTLSVTFRDAGQDIRVVDLPIKSVPFAMQAEQISGYSVNYLFKIAGPAQPGDKPTGVFARGAVDLLWELAHNQDLQGQTLKNLGAPVNPADAANKAYVDSIVATQGSLAITDVTGDANVVVGTLGSVRAVSLGTTGVAAGTYGAASGTGVMVPVLNIDMWGRITQASEQAIPTATGSGGLGLITVDTTTGLTINSGTLGLNLTNLSGANFGPQSANVVFAGPTSGTTGAVTFRALVQDDIPVLAATGKVQNSATTATPNLVNDAIVARDATGSFTASSAFLNYLALDNGLGAGTSSAIMLSAPIGATYSLVFPGTAPNAGDLLSFDGLGNMVWVQPSSMGMTGLELIVPSGEMTVSAPVGTGMGTLTIGWADQNARMVFAAPVAGSGAPSFRALDPLDIPDLDAAKITTGTLDVNRIPDLDASKITTGILGVQRGGTGLDGSLASTGQLMIGTGTGGFALGQLYGGSGVTIDPQSGSIGISFDASSAGVVTNVGATVPSFMSVSPSAISSSGTFAFDFNSQNQNFVFAAPTGGSGSPDFRLLDPTDIPSLDTAKITTGTFATARIPDLDASKITTGTLGVQRGGTGLAPQIADANRLYGINAAGDNSEFKTLTAGSGVVITHSTGSIAFEFDPAAAGVVTNVGLTAPTAVFNVTGSAVTGAGTLGIDFVPQAALSVFAAPTGGTGQPSFRALTPADIPYLDTSHLNSGILPVDRGGTGLDGTFAADGQLLIGNGSGYSLNTLMAASGVIITNGSGAISIGFDPVTAGVVTNVGLTAPTSVFTVSGSAVTGAGTLGLSLNNQGPATVFAAPTGSTGAPSFRILEPSDIPDLDASKITSGTLPTDLGGTGLDTSAAANGQLLIGDGAGLALGYIIGGSGVIVSNNAGSIGISFDPLTGGVVTNVGASVPSYMSVTPASISSSGTFAFDFNSQNQNLVFAAPTGASGAPGFRVLDPTDIPSLDTAKITTGTFATARIPDLDTSKIVTGTLGVQRGGTGLAPQIADANRLYGINAAGDNSEFKTLAAGSGVIITHSTGSISFDFDPVAAGVVTNVGLTAPTSIFNVSGSAVTGAGTLGLSLIGQGQNMVFAAPTGASGTPGFRVLDPTDIPSLDTGKITTGTFATARIPDLDTSKITTGTLGVQRGGTGLDASSASNGQLLIGNGTGFSLNTLTAQSGVLLTNGSGSISIGFDPVGAGVVTNVGLTAPTSVFSVTGSAVTGAGTLGLQLLSQNTATVLAAPTGASGVPSFRSLEATDITSGTFATARIPDLDTSKVVTGTFATARIPDLDTSKIVTGTLGVQRGGTGLAPQASDANRLYGINGAGSNSEFKTLVAGSGVIINHSAGSIGFTFDPLAAGVVTNVGATVPSYMSVSPASISSSGTFAFDFNSQAQATVFAAPTGASGAPSFRSLIATDITAGTFATARIPDLDTSKIATGTLGVQRGGTGLDASSASNGQLLIGNGSGFSLNTLTAQSGVLLTNGSGSISIGFDPVGAGVVTNVGLTAPTSVFSVTGSAVTGAGTLGLQLLSQNTATVLAAPTGASGVPSFRSLEATDITAGTFATARIPDLDASKVVTGTFATARIPDLDTSKIVTGTLGVQRGGTGLDASSAANGQLLIGNGTGFALGSIIGGSGVIVSNNAGSIGIAFDPLAGGVVTNVGASVPSYMSVTPASISSSGTFAFDFNSQAQATVFAAPTGASGAPSFRSLIATDITAGTFATARIPDLDTSKIVTGTLGVQRGGTGLAPQASDANRLYGINNAGSNSEFKTLVAGSGVVINHSTGSISLNFDPVAAGVVTNVGLTAPTSVFNVTGSAVTGAGTLGLQLLSQNTATVLAAPTGASGVPSFRSLIATDITAGTFATARIPDLDASKVVTGTFATARIPDLDTSKIVTGTLGVQRGGTGLDASSASNGQILIGNGTGFSLNTLTAASGVVITNSAGSISIAFDPLAGGVVTNVGATVPSYMTVTPASISSSGTFAFDFSSQAPASVFAAPTGASGQPTFRSLIASDITAGTFATARIPDLDASKITTGTLGVNRGGTGLNASTAASGQLLIGTGTGFALNTLTAGSGVTITNAAGSIGIGFNPSAAGVVTNVGLTAPTSIFNVTGSAVTGAGTLGLGLISQNTATVLAAPTGASGVPSFRSLVATDITAGTFATARIPDLDASKITTGTLPTSRGGTGLVPVAGDANKLYAVNGAGTGAEFKSVVAGSGVTISNTTGTLSFSFNPSAAGVVTNVGLTAPTSVFNVTGSAVTGAGTLGLGFVSQNTATVLAAPTGASGVPSFRSLVATDITSGTFATARIPDLDASKITTGTLGVNRGGTGLNGSTAANGQILIGNGSGFSLNTLTAGSGVTITNAAGSIGIGFNASAAGVVTNVGLTAPTSIFNVTGSAVTGAGTLGLGLISQNTATVLAAPTGASGVPSFRSLIASDITAGTFATARIPDLDASKITTGTLGVNRGGTGLNGSGAAAGQLLIGTGSGFALNTLTAGSGVTITNSAGSIGIGFNASAAGVVTNVGLTAPTSVFSVTGSAVTGAGTLGLGFLSQNTATVLAAPTGASGVPSFRSLIASDITAGTFATAQIPDLDASKITTGTLPTSRGGTGLVPVAGDANKLYAVNGAGTGAEFKSVIAGSGVSIVNGSGSLVINATGLGGTVTNVGLTAPTSIFNVTGSAVTGAGTLGLGLISQNTATVLAAPTGASGVPSFRSLIASDITAGTFATARIPDLDTSKITTGTLGVNRGGTGLNGSSAANGQLLIGNGSGFSLNTLTAGSGVTITNAAGSINIGFNSSAAGVVTNVGLTAPTSIFNVTGSAVTGAGTLGLGLISQNTATVLAAPTGASGVPSFRSLIASDITAGTFATARIPDLDASKITTGTLGVNRGGTGLNGSSAAAGQLLIGTGTGFALNTLTAGSGVTITNAAGSINIGFNSSAAGVVTNVGLTAPTSVFSVTGSAVTGAGTLGLGFLSQNTATVLAAPTGASGVPSFRSLIASDITAGTFATARIPDLDASKITTGTLPTSRGGTGLVPVAGDANKLYAVNGAGTGAEFKTVIAGSGVSIVNGSGSIVINASGLGGTVTNVGLTAPSSVFNVTGSAITGAGTLGLSFANQAAATVFAAPTGASGAPSFRALASTDIPNLDASKITTGTLGVNRGGTGLNGSTAANGQLLIGNGTGFTLRTLTAGTGVTIANSAGSINISVGSGVGTVQNVGLSAPTSIFNVTGSAVTGVGTLGLNLVSQNAATVFAAPTGASGTPSFRSLIASDITAGTFATARIPDLDASKITTGTLGVNRGGTGLNGSTAANGQLLIGNGSGFSLRTLTAGTGITIVNTAGSINISSSGGPGTLGIAQGGNSFGTAVTVGSNDNFGLNFETNGSTKMAINAGGSVGVGTTTPQAPFQVGDDLTFEGNWPSIGFNAGVISGGNRYIVADSASRIFQDYGNDALTFNVAQPGTVGNTITWATAMSMKASGNIGIGTQAPSGILHLVGTTSANSALVLPVATTANRPTAAINGMIRYNSTTNKFEGRQGGSWVDLGGGAAYTGAGTMWSFTANGMDIKTTDPYYVKINSPDNTDPAAPLHVVGNVYLEDSTDIQFENGGVRTWYSPGGWNTNYGSLAWYTFTANNGVNIGVNEASPAVALDVAHTYAGNSAIRIPRATTAQRPTGSVGMMRYNTTTNKFEAYEGSAWVNMIGGGTSQWTTSGSNIYYNSGSVGIGTTNPVDPLHVHKATGDGWMTISSGAANANAGISLIGRGSSADKYAGIFVDWGGNVMFDADTGIYAFRGVSNSGGLTITDGRGLFESRGSDGSIDITSTATNANAGIGLQSRSGGSTLYGYINADYTNNFVFSSRGGLYTFKNAADSGNLAYINSSGVNAPAFLYTSDATLKKDVVDVEGLDLILKMKGHRFRWIENDKPEIGLIAQEVEKIAPDLVVTNPETGKKAVKYGNLVAPLIESTKELYGLCKASEAQWAKLADQVEKNSRDIASVRAENEDLKQRVERLEKMVEILMQDKSK